MPQIDTVSIGSPITVREVTFFPLYLAEHKLPAITTGEDSGLVVEEHALPTVQSLRVRNPGDKPALIVEGEHFLGGDQNRATNATVLVPSLGDLAIPVSCLEHGRWGSRRTVVRDDAFTPARVRAAKMERVAGSLRRSGSHDGDQGAVWDEVDAMMERSSVDSATAAAADVGHAARRRDPSRAEDVERLAARGPLPGQCGIVVADGYRVTAMDLFGAPHLLAAHWGRLVRSYLLEPHDADGCPSATQALEVIRHFASAPARSAPAIGLGVERSVADERLAGSALLLDEALVHAAFFTTQPSEETGIRHRDEDAPTPRPPVERGDRRRSPMGDRASGLLAGIAAGNLLGIAMEGWSRTRIAAAFPGGVRQIVARTGWPDDDDVAQALVIADAAAAGPLDPHDLGQRFWRWAETNGAGMGGLTRDVLSRYGGAAPQRLARNRRTGAARAPAGVPITEASEAAWRGSRAGNGAAMRCAPIAVRWRDDAPALVRNAIVSAVPTHWDRRCGWSCALLNLAAASALRGESMTADDLLAAGLDGVRAALPELRQYGYEARVPTSVLTAVRQASAAAIDDLRVGGNTMGYTLVALQVGLVSYWRASSFEQGLSQVIEAGGDTDTNGAVAGALLGARFGLEAIPPRWRDRVAEIRAGRPTMESYADRLLAARDAGPVADLPSSGAETLACHVRSLPDFVHYTTIDGRYDHVGATVADAVLQANTKYSTHVKPRVRRILDRYPETRTTSAALRVLESTSAAEFIDWKGPKVRRFTEVLNLLAEEGVETEADLRAWLSHESNVPKLRSIFGIGPKTIDYFKILVGISTVAIDRHLLGFLEDAGLGTPSYSDAQELIARTADILRVDRAHFDHSIWQYMRKKAALRGRRHDATPACVTVT